VSRDLAGLVAELGARGLLEPGSVRLADGRARGVTGVAYDSRRVTPGDLFVALAGQRDDGRRHAAAAVAAGAVAVMTETPVRGLDVPQVLVRSGRAALALAAAWLHGHPSRDLGVVGVTGTDGKTTTAYLVRAMLERVAGPTGLVGTIDVVCGGRSLGNVARATTPEAPELQGYLARMRDAGDRWAVLESTSHGLAQERVGEVAYDVAVLTNIGREHLEFHGTEEAYRAAKRRLFERLAVGPSNPEKGLGKAGVVNTDDAHATGFLAAAREAGARVVTYGLAPADAGRGPDASVVPPAADAVRLVGSAVAEDASGVRLRVAGPRWCGPVRLRLAGRFNAHNALAALGVAEALGLDPARAAEALASVEAVPGRMQRVDEGQPFVVVVDYAHTAEALAKVLDELAPLAAAGGGGLIAVFGSAGERDTEKRPAMGRVAAGRCRLVVLTDEDPRAEDRMAILEAIAAGAEAAGMRRGGDLLLVADRGAAIERALAAARPGDVVLLAGKGHERTIETAMGDLAWDEAAVARAALRRLGHGGARRPGPSRPAQGATAPGEAAGEGGGD
jgi:UDP-N-acetylmuramoyl-L-alanyl-D-glutamate--2,6-diaminopimelate ligase